MERLIKLFAFFIHVLKGNRQSFQVLTDQLTESASWETATTNIDVTDVSVTNLSSGTVYVNELPLGNGGSIVDGAEWNEFNQTKYIVRIPAALVTKLVIIRYKKIKIIK